MSPGRHSFAQLRPRIRALSPEHSCGTQVRLWLDRLGSGTTTAPDGTTTRRPRSARAPRPETGEPGRADDTTEGTTEGTTETTEQRLARRKAENAALRAERTTLVTEREILRAAAKYFAGETNW
jgi:transposase